jgi:hypothetical protein
MDFICTGIAFVALVALLIQCYQTVHRWDDEWDSLAIKEHHKAVHRETACHEIWHQTSGLPPVSLKQGQSSALSKGPLMWEEEQVVASMVQRHSLHEDFSRILTKHNIAYMN